VERFECVSRVLKFVHREDQSSFDIHCPLMSVPHLLGTSLDTIPNIVPYIDVPKELVDAWQMRLQPLNGLKVGLVWAGGKQTAKDHLRSVQLAQFRPLFSAADVQFINLQKGDPKNQLAASGFPIVDWMDECVDVMGTAALIANLDLVISVDTSMAHLAGALGVPVWMMNRHESEWRWLLEREDSPWYPSMRIFNQQLPGEWDAVIRKMAGELERLSEAKK
jgi:hypothetical protein